MTDDKKPIETKDVEWTYDGGKKFPMTKEDLDKLKKDVEIKMPFIWNPFDKIIRDFTLDKLLDPNSPFNMFKSIKNGNIKFFNGDKEFFPFGKFQGTEGFTQPAKPESDARKLKVCDGNCEDCW